MSLLQHPIKSLDQIEWYLDNRKHEHFPGAFLLAAGNLSRQVLEQILFILAFYAGMPKNRYLRDDDTLRTAGQILNALRQPDPSGIRYFERARRRGPRIRKFARFPRSLNKWRDRLNEPSHFRNPAAKRRTRERDIREFTGRLRQSLDKRDAHLITAAVNELRSNGRIKAILGNDENNTPGLQFTAVVRPNNIHFENGNLSLRGPAHSFRVLPDTHDVPHRWPTVPVLVQHSANIMMVTQLVTESGDPVDLRTGETILSSFSKTEQDRKRLRRRLRKLGLEIEWKERNI